MQLSLSSPEPMKPELLQPYLLAQSTTKICLDPTTPYVLEFCEPRVHDAATPNLLSLQSPNSDMKIHV